MDENENISYARLQIGDKPVITRAFKLVGFVKILSAQTEPNLWPALNQTKEVGKKRPEKSPKIAQ